MKKDTSPILSLSSLVIGYRSGRSSIPLLPPLSAAAEKGELIAIIGRNGIGKSTLIKTLAGVHPALSGDVIYFGTGIKEHSGAELARKVGFISTEIVRGGHMTVYELVALGRYPHTNWFGRISRKDKARIIEAIEMAGLSGFLGRYISELSDGERQKAMIARLLAQDTSVMVMDEPTAFLDIGSRYEILHLLHTLSRKNKKTILFSTHDLHTAISQADKIWLITEQELIEGSPEDLILNGAFDNLFETPHVKFDSESGSYIFKGEESLSIYVEGKGNIKLWTEKAIRRGGFSVSAVKTNPYISVPDTENKKWRLFSKTSILEFDSIYDLLKNISAVSIL